MRFSSLPEWLAWQESLHPKSIDLGLDRASTVWKRLVGTAPLPFKIITVAGTNGKGSSVSLLDSILRTAGYRIGRYTSPHLLKYNERIAIDNQLATDQEICDAFHHIDIARDDISLTYFEFATLAAVWLFIQKKIEIAILEVGMGGRLDAVNLWDADIVLITPIGLDHTRWLGTSREAIAAEKAGVIKQRKRVVYHDPSPLAVIHQVAYQHQCHFSLLRQDFHYQYEKGQALWHWFNAKWSLERLPLPRLQGQHQIANAAAVLQVIFLLTEFLHIQVDKRAIATGLQQSVLPGRFQILPVKNTDGVEHILDVSHNEEGASCLADTLLSHPCHGKRYALLAMLNDKDPAAVVKPLLSQIDHWVLAGLPGERGYSAKRLSAILAALLPENTSVYESVEQACLALEQYTGDSDQVIIFGSFYTVEKLITHHTAASQIANGAVD